MPARPMFRSPHKKFNPWSRGYNPSPGSHTSHGDDKGNVPIGKKKKQDRVKSGPVGSPNGKHDAKNPHECRCGRCLTIA